MAVERLIGLSLLVLSAAVPVWLRSRVSVTAPKGWNKRQGADEYGIIMMTSASETSTTWAATKTTAPPLPPKLSVVDTTFRWLRSTPDGRQGDDVISDVKDDIMGASATS